MKNAWLLIPVAAMILLQWRLLDRTPERLEEARTTRLHELEATSMIPAYIASLFLGSFRAIAVDAAWLELDRAEKEKRFHRKREILQFIKFLQPRNEEVHMLLAWNMMFNMPAIVSHREKWRWEKQGLKMYREAMDILPGSPFVRFQTGLDIEKKGTPGAGMFESRFIQSFIEDEEVQLWYSGRRDARRSPFECSTEILMQSKALLREHPDSSYRSQGGLLCTDYFADNLARNNFLYQAFYLRNLGVQHRRSAEAERNPDKAKARLDEAARCFDAAEIWFDKGAAFCRGMMNDYDFVRRPTNIVYRYTELFAQLKAAIRVELTGSTRDILDRYRPLIQAFGTLDERYLYTSAQEAMRTLSGDIHELNDRDIDSEPFPPGEWVTGKIWPSDDVDYFRFWDTSRPFQPHERTFVIRNPGSIPLTLSLEHEAYGMKRTLAAPIPIRAKMPADQVVTFSFPIDLPGSYTLVFRSADPNAPETLDSTYTFRVISPKK